MTVDTDDLAQGDGECVVPVDAVPGHDESKSGRIVPFFFCNKWTFFLPLLQVAVSQRAVDELVGGPL